MGADDCRIVATGEASEVAAMTTITVEDYRTDVEKRAEADRVMAAGGLEKNDVFEIVDLGDRYRVGLFVRDADGKIVIAESDGWVVEDSRTLVRRSEPVRRWVEVTLP
jgi:hypothetical protein